MIKSEKYSFSDVLDVRDGTHDSPKYIEEGFPLITSKNLVSGRINFDNVNFISEQDFIAINKRSKVDVGDILYSMIGSIGNFAIVNSHANFAIKNVALFKFKNEKLTNKYLVYFIQSNEFLKQINSQSKGGTQKFVTLKILRNIQIPLPTLPQQQKIANILDAADALRQKDKALLAKYDELTQALFLDMFGDPVSNPKGWEKVETIKYCTSIVPGRDKPKSFTGDTPWVTTNDLYHLSYTSGSKSKIGLSDEEISQVRAKIIPENSVIMTCVGDLGVITVNKVKMVVNQQLHAFICNDKLNSIFLMHSLSYQKPYMYKMASSTTVPYMNKTVCNNIPTIVPPTSLQNQFAERVKLIEQQKAIAQKSLDKSEELFNSLLQKAFKGEL